VNVKVEERIDVFGSEGKA